MRTESVWKNGFRFEHSEISMHVVHLEKCWLFDGRMPERDQNQRD